LPIAPDCNTREDSLKATFDPVLKPESKNEFYKIWKSWFVTENTIEDEKAPGKLKSKF
jgi:hypothetical protein